MDIATETLEKLRHDRDTVTLETGCTLRLRIEGTERSAIENINDCDAYGKVAWVEDDRNSVYGHHKDRPEGFDGAARILHPSGWHIQDPVWWQPCSTVIEAGPEAIAKTAKLVTRLLGDGFYTIIVELLDGKDAYGRPIVVDVASLGGCDDGTPEYVATVLTDLVSELAS